ncbi:MAG TPA: nucleotidyltransferase domain-containing protein [Candidatus Binatia bacterium]|nr:nucleotidyltransferase domain-containing protein [Candidatus Binatia bacterium]
MVKRSQRLYEIAESQQGYFTSTDAKSLGYDYPHQHFHVKRGNWVRVDHGIFRLKNFPSASHEDLIRWWLWTRRKGTISHETAAAVYDLADTLPATVHLTVPPDFRKKPPEGVSLHKAKLAAADFQMRDGFPVTKPLRTIADLTLSHIDPERLSAVLQEALQQGLVDKKDLLALSSKLSKKSERSVQEVLDIAIAGTDRAATLRTTGIEMPRVSETAAEWKQNRFDIQFLLNELKLGLQSIYGKQLKGIYLFGSYARGEADRESDLDILVVLDGFDRYAHEVNRTGALAADLSLKYGVTVSLVFLREHDWLKGDTPFLSNVRDEAIPV